MSLIDIINIDYNKILGKGKSGIIYLGKLNNNKYAIKYRKILKSDYNELVENTHGQYIFWKKLNFLYPKLFLTLYDYKVDNNNYYINFSDQNISDKDIEYQKYKNKVWNSPYTIIECISIIDDTLDKLYNKPKIYYNCFIQYAYQIYILYNYDFINRDVHIKNVGIIKTKPKIIDILSYKIKNYGYKTQMIDYEDLHHISWTSYKNNIENYNGTYYFLIINQNLIYNCNNFEKYYKKFIDTNEILYDKNFIIKDKYKKKIKKYLPNEQINNLEKIENILFKILYQKKFQKQLLKLNFYKFIKFDFLIPIKTILFIIKNIKKPDTILYYLIENNIYL
jgi:hypothetical protein